MSAGVRSQESRILQWLAHRPLVVVAALGFVCGAALVALLQLV